MKRILPASQGLLSKILAFSITFTIIFTTIIGTLAYVLSTEVVKNDTHDKLAAIAIVKENNLNRWVDEQRRNIVFLAALPELRQQAGLLETMGTVPQMRAQAVQELSNYFRTAISTMSDSQEILLLNNQGEIIHASVQEHIGLDQSHEAYFIQGLTQTWVTSFHTSPLLNTPTITISTPLFDAEGKRIGVLASHLSLNEVDRIIRERTGLGQSGEVYLVNTQRQLVSIDPLAVQNGKYLSSPGIDLALQAQEGSGSYQNYRGIPVFGAYRWVSEREVALLVEVSQEESLSQVNSLAHWIGWVGLGIIALSSFLISVFARRVIRPIEKLTQTATKIAGGDLDLRVPVNSKDEVGRLAEAFNVMTAELQKTLSGLKDLNEQLETRVEERTAELKNSNHELEAFSYSISHDLRAPLRAITGYSQIVLEQIPANCDPTLAVKLEQIHENAVFMGKMVDGLLSFSRYGRQSIRPRTLASGELQGMITHIISDLRSNAPHEGLNVEIGALNDCFADPLLINQVFTNLISNAFKFSRQRPAATVKIGCTETDKGRAYFVCDNGVGFDMQYAAKLFGVFQRLHKQEDFEGTGVGLAIVQRVIHRHKGSIWAEAERDKGATFYFTLGLSESDVDEFSDTKPLPR